MITFCYDGPIYRCNGEYYTTSFSDEILKRYKEICPDLSIAFRVKSINMANAKKFSKITCDLVDIVECRDVTDIKHFFMNWKMNQRLLEDIIDKSACVVVRIPSVIGLMASKIARKKGKTVMAEVVGNAKETLYYHNLLGKIVCVPFHVLTKRLIRDANYVVYITKQYLQEVYPTKGVTQICPNVILESTNNCIIEKKVNGYRNGFDGNQIVLGSVGSVSEKYKGHEYVIRAIPHLKKMGINVEYRLGSGDDHRRLAAIARKCKVEKNVRFCGAINHEDIDSFYDAVDIYIQPSLTEAQGRSLMEAMNRGCICICSHIGGMIELIPQEQRFAAKNPEQIAVQIKKLCNMSGEELMQISMRNYQEASQYRKEIIEERRSSFFRRIRKEIICE